MELLSWVQLNMKGNANVVLPLRMVKEGKPLLSSENQGGLHMKLADPILSAKVLGSQLYNSSTWLMLDTDSHCLS